MSTTGGPNAPQYLIWSLEHTGWWRPGGIGYTVSRDIAGRFSLDEATAIVNKGNQYIDGRKAPMEAIVPDLWTKGAAKK